MDASILVPWTSTTGRGWAALGTQPKSLAPSRVGVAETEVPVGEGAATAVPVPVKDRAPATATAIAVGNTLVNFFGMASISSGAWESAAVTCICVTDRNSRTHRRNRRAGQGCRSGSPIGEPVWWTSPTDGSVSDSCAKLADPDDERTQPMAA